MKTTQTIHTSPNLLPLISELHCEQTATYEIDVSGVDYKSPLWDFCRRLKGEPEMKNTDARLALRRVEVCLNELGLTWTDFSEINDDEDGRIEFLAIWDTIRFVDGYGPLEAALDKAILWPVHVPVKCERTEGYRRFVGVAYWLQELMTDEDIYLPTRKLGTLLGCSHETVARYTKFAVADGILRRTKPHHFSAAGGSSAAEFRFIAACGVSHLPPQDRAAL